jgi:hypothetical protein
VEHVVRHLGVSERKACAVLGQHPKLLLRGALWMRRFSLEEV